MTERGFHPFAVLHFLRKTILLYLLPLLQVLFARNWAALRTALVQGAALLTVLAAVSAAVLHAGRWRVDAQGTLRVRWRLGVRLDRCLKASQLAALTIERPLLYRLAGASRVVLYPAAKSPGGHRRPQHPGVFSACRHPLRAVPAADSGIPLHPARPHGAAAGGHCCVCRPVGGCVQRLAQRGHLAAKRPPDPALAARLPSARHLRALPCSGPDGHAVAVGRGGAPHEPHPHLSGRGEVQGAQRKVQRTAFFAFLKL